MKSIRSLCKLSAVALLLAVAASDLQGADAAGRRLQKGGCGVKPDGSKAPAATPATTPASIPSSTPAPSLTPAADADEDDDEDVVPPSTPAPSDDDDNETPDDGTDAENEASVIPSVTTKAPASGSTTTKAPAATTKAPAAGTTTKAPAAAPANNGTLCATPKVTVSEIDVGQTVTVNEDEAALKLVAISAKPSGGSYVAFHSGTKAYVVELDASDKVVTGSQVAVNVHDFGDIHADDKGFVILGTRDAQGGGTLNCGNPANLCGSAPSPAVPCYDMYLIRYEGGKETWATKLTDSSASLPPYSTGKTGKNVYMIWWYAHHGRIAYDGTNWASYFGAAISTSEGGCINIHQGDRMQIVGPTGSLVKNANAFDWGCSHSGYERVLYDDRSKEFTGICKTDNNNRIKFPTSDTTIYPVDLAASNLGDIVKDGASGYWMTVSNGQGNNAKVHLMHFNKNKATDKDIVLGGAMANERACHLAEIGKGGMLAVWEGSSAGGDLEENSTRQMYVQVRSASDGAQVSSVVKVDGVKGNRYQAFREFPDGSVAYVAKGSAGTKLKVVRVSAC